MTYVDHPASTPVIPVPLFEEERQSDGRHSFTYLLLFPVVGLFFAIITLALTPTEWLPDSGTAAFVQEMWTPAGLDVPTIPTPAGLQKADGEYSAV
jgi:hypothetical protein